MNIDKAVNTILVLDRTPVAELEGFIPEQLRKEILAELKANAARFASTPRIWGNARQDFDVLHVDEHIAHHFPALQTLVGVYDHIDAQVKSRKRMYRTAPEVWVQHYWQGSIGITTHKDESAKKNYIAIAVIAGASRFGHSQIRDDPVPRMYEAKPGSVLLMRAPQPYDKMDRRPFHFVEPCDQERYSVVFRQMRT